jgi:hypothetical protein
LSGRGAGGEKIPTARPPISPRPPRAFRNMPRSPSRL